MTGRFSRKTLIVILLLALALEVMWVIYMTNKDSYSLSKQAGNESPSQSSDKSGAADYNRQVPFNDQLSGSPRPAGNLNRSSPGTPRNDGFRNPPPGFLQENFNKQAPYDNTPRAPERENNSNF